MNKIPIVFALDNNYIEQLAAVIASILQNSSSSTYLEFNILHNGIPEINKNKIKKLNKINNNCKFNFIDMIDFIKNKNLDNYISKRNDYNYITSATYYRFYLTNIFPDYDKVLYLDVDTIVLKDLWNVFNINLNENIAGVVEDLWIKKLYKKSKPISHLNITYRQYFEKIYHNSKFRYFNAGFILLNLKKMREENIDNKLWEYLEDNHPLVFLDQDVLNAVFKDKTIFLDKKWNCFQGLNKCLFPAVIHYVGAEKPWNMRCPNRFWGTWWKYFSLTDFYCEKKTKSI